MSDLTGKQKRFLRSLGQSRKVDVTIGKAGLCKTTIAQVQTLLGQSELIKVRQPAGPGSQRKQIAAELAQACNAETVGLVGRTLLLYRPNADIQPDKQIELP